MISPDPKLPFLDVPEKWLSRFVERFYRLWRELYDELKGVRDEIYSGTYTPTLTTVANLSGTHTAYECQYLRVGKTVTVSGRCLVSTITAGTTLTKLRVSLPIASAFTQNYQLAGTLGDDAFDPGVIKSDSTNDEAEFSWYPSGTASTNKILWFHFTYQIL